MECSIECLLVHCNAGSSLLPLIGVVAFCWSKVKENSTPSNVGSSCVFTYCIKAVQRFSLMWSFPLQLILVQNSPLVP